MQEHQAEFRFYGDLLDFLHEKCASLIRSFGPTASVKDMIEAFGVPHPEVGLVMVDGGAVGWDYLVADGDRIAVYPRFRSLAVATDSPVAWTGDPRFVLDCHLGRLARYLRLLGFDTLHEVDYTDEQLAEIARQENRIVLTRDVGVLKRSAVRRGRFVREVRPFDQAAEVIGCFGLTDRFRPFTRCMVCNGGLCPADRRAVERLVPEAVRLRHGDFRQCSRCDRVYWEGSHHTRLLRIIEEIRERAGVL